MAKLTLFYDGTCPLCVGEMRSLHRYDNTNQIRTVDIHSEEFAEFPQIDPKQANLILHAIDSEGTLYLGLDAAHQAWGKLGRGWLYAPLRWKIIRPLADKIYLYFARNRYRISYLLTGTSRCESCRID
ncbi:thiol-disulfide oxidoreductase DCC family protein [Vibrio maerlii]|uniref:thiol-disulfide oxidoreductase DCC family protein n=1 Tax=Vibrio maerlii TaxID=2231648 RepID=UPI000E3C710F|nr:DUF393 domain-containing protein [Vibrio maerlii]